ncbi:MAG: dihydroorotate dehydrogenase [Candidatus Neomarinimicrobiota bacterium]
MVDLKVALGEKLALQNPILSASGTFGYGDELPELVDVNELGGLVTKSLTRHPREGHPPPRIAETPAGMLNAIGLANIGVERFCAEKLPYLNGLKTTVVASVAGSTIAEYLEVVEYIEAQGPDIAGYEINISCPNVKEGGMEFGVSAKITEELTARLRPLSDRLLMVKLSPNVTSISDIARAAQQGGADAVCAINTVVGMGVDPHTGQFQVSTGLAGLSGPAIRPIALAAVYEVARAVTIPVIGVGGIMNGADAMSLVRAGAHAVQIGTANYRDPATGVKVVSQLRALMEELGVESLSELRGSASA